MDIEIGAYYNIAQMDGHVLILFQSSLLPHGKLSLWTQLS